MTDILETVKTMMESGASTEEIIETLKEMGVDEDDARKLIILANKEILRVLVNEIREIASDAFVERAEEMKTKITEEVTKEVQKNVERIRKDAFKILRDEVQRYIATISSLEDRVNILEKRVLSLEDKVYSGKKKYGLKSQKFRKMSILKYLLVLLGISSLAYVLYFGIKGFEAAPFIAVGIVLIVGGFLLG